MVNTTNGKVSRGRTYHTANKDRVDTTTHLPAMMGQPARDRETHTITDREQKLIYVVDPQKKLILVNYALQIVSHDDPDRSPDKSCAELAKASGSMVAMKGASNCKQLGSENVNGRSAAIWELHVGMGAIQLGSGGCGWIPSGAWRSSGGLRTEPRANSKMSNSGRSRRASLCSQLIIADKTYRTSGPDQRNS